MVDEHGYEVVQSTDELRALRLREPLVEPNGEWDQVNKSLNRSILVKQVGHIRGHHGHRHHDATQLAIADPAYHVAGKQMCRRRWNHLVDDVISRSRRPQQPQSCDQPGLIDCHSQRHRDTVGSSDDRARFPDELRYLPSGVAPR